MRIILSKYAGFCDGVERAYQMVLNIAKDKKIKKPIFVLGSLVHNDDVVEKIEKLGIRKIKVTPKIFKDLDKLNSKIGTLAITAHGMGPEIYEFCRRKNINLIDTTCPRVIKVQRLARVFLQKGYKIIIIGEKDHKEVKGINEWADKKGIFIENEEDLEKIKFSPKQKLLVISQTTQNQDFVKKAAAYIRKKFPTAEIIDTICLATHNRQSEIRKMAKTNEAMIVIGSPESANSTRLWEIAREINPRSYFVERAGQIKKKWLAGIKKVGVTAGASAPQWIIDEVVEYLKKINS